MPRRLRRLRNDLLAHVRGNWYWIVFDPIASFSIVRISMLKKSWHAWGDYYLTRVCHSDILPWVYLYTLLLGVAWFLIAWMKKVDLGKRWRNNLGCRPTFFSGWDHFSLLYFGALVAIAPYLRIAVPDLLKLGFLALVMGVFFSGIEQTRARIQRAIPPRRSKILPIESSQEDKLNRAPTVDLLLTGVRRVWRSKDYHGGIIGLCGEFGIGKTSIINLLRNRIHDLPAKRVKPIVAKVSPWPIRGGAAVQKFLLSEINAAVSAEFNCSEIGNTISQFIDILEKGWSEKTGVLRRILGHEPPTIERELSSLREMLARLPTKLLIVVEDLDRLTPDETYSIMRVADQLRTLPNTAIILCYDPATTPRKFAIAAEARLGSSSGI